VIVLVIALVGWHLHGHRDTRGATERAEHAGSAAPGMRHVPSVPASLAGRVTRKSDGAGVAGATVAVARVDRMPTFERSGEPPLVIATDASGGWTIANVPPGEYAASASASGFVPATRGKLAISSAQHATGIDFVLEAGGTLVHGTISDFGGGPIAGASVEATQQSLRAITGSAAPSVALSDAHGHYELSLADGTYYLSAGHDDYTSHSRTIELAGKPLTVDFSLVPGGIVRGQVIARDTGKPVAGALVHGQFKHGLAQGGGRGATSDGDGKFLLRGVGAGALSIDAAARGYATASPTVVELGIGEQVDGVRVVVDRARAISGRVVVKGTQTGIAGVHVAAWSMGSGVQAEAPDPTDANGAFELVGVRPGTYLLAAIAEDEMPEIGKNVEVADKDVTGVVVEMAAGATVSGRVDPPSRAQLGITPAGDVGLGNVFEVLKSAFVQADTDAAGKFTLEHVPAGKFTLVATTAEGPAGKLPLTVATENQSGLVVTLETRASIAGTVVDTNGKPVDGVRVVARTEDKDQMIRVAMSGSLGRGVTSAADGTFKIVGLEPGKYTVHVADLEDLFETKDGVKRADAIVLAAGEARAGVTVTIAARDGVIRGVVIGGDGQPAPDSWVTARAQSLDGVTSFGGRDLGDVEPVLANGDGKFAVEHLRTGTYTLVAEGPRGASHAEQKDAKPGDTVTLTLQPLGTLSGHVTLSGAAAPSFAIACSGPSGRIDRQVDSADGAYSLEHLVPGHFTCDATADGGTATGEVDVPPGTATLDLALQPYASIVGSVVSVLDGSPVPGAALAAEGGHGDALQMESLILGNGPMTDATGHFQLDRIAPGSGAVIVMATTSLGKPLATKPYTVTAGQRLDLGPIQVVPPRSGDAGTLGMATDAEASDLAVTTVSPGGPAASAGIVAGDKITAIDGHAVGDLTGPVAETIVSSGTLAAGQTVALTLARGATVSVTAAKW
jgi:protocatechuate 3,4-dioxygenase beta subunit